MNLVGFFVLILIILAIFVAVKLLLKFGFVSWEFWFGGVGIIFTAALFLIVLNKFGISLLQVNAEGIVGQTQNMLHNAFPQAVSESDVSINTWFASGDDAESDQTTKVDEGQVVITTSGLPEEGSQRYVGTTEPSGADQYRIYQVQCIGTSFNQWQNLAMMGQVPYGVRVELTSQNNRFFNNLQSEKWILTFYYPNPVSGEVNGVEAKQIKKANGAFSFVGEAPWPLVKETYIAGEWKIVEGNFCP